MSERNVRAQYPDPPAPPHRSRARITLRSLTLEVQTRRRRSRVSARRSELHTGHKHPVAPSRATAAVGAQPVGGYELVKTSRSGLASQASFGGAESRPTAKTSIATSNKAYLGAAASRPAATPLFPIQVHRLPVCCHHHKSPFGACPAKNSWPFTPAGAISCNEPPAPIHGCHPFPIPTINVFRQTAPAASRITTAMLPLNDAIRGSIFAAAPPLNQVPHVLPATRTAQVELKLSLATT